MNTRCPYCDKSIYIDPENYGEDGSMQQHKCDCGKTFIFVAEMTVDVTTYKADCLNGGGEHKYARVSMFPYLNQDGKLIVRCVYCGEKKGMPVEEGEKYGFTKEQIDNAIEFYKELEVKP